MNKIAVDGTTSKSQRLYRSSPRRCATVPAPYALQAAIGAEHGRAGRAEETNWIEILRLHGLLEQVQPSPVVSLKRAVAAAIVHGPRRGLEINDGLMASNEPEDFHLMHAARADLLRRLVLTA
jgi:RNA polymerase sigma-70 factor, ECF subfamily